MNEKGYTNFDKFLDNIEIKSHTIKSFFWNLAYKLKELKWWILYRVHPKYRYHVLKYRNIKPGWHDVDYKMLHACFDLFLDFIEKEDGLKDLKYQYTWLENDEEDWTYMTKEEREEFHKKNKEIYEEALYLYNWWTKVYPANKGEIYTDSTAYDDETEHLIRLIKLRKCFWT